MCYLSTNSSYINIGVSTRIEIWTIYWPNIKLKSQPYSASINGSDISFKILNPALMSCPNLKTNPNGQNIDIQVSILAQSIQLQLNVWSCVFWDEKIERLSKCIVCTYRVFLQCECEGGFSSVLLLWMSSHTLCSDVVSLRCGWADAG